MSLRLLPALRPQTRADCVEGLRPCPWASCRYSLLVLDLNTRTGRVWEPEDPDAIVDSCVLDVADRGGMNEPEIAAVFGVTRQAVNLTIARAIVKLKRLADPRWLDGWTHVSEPVADKQGVDVVDAEFSAAVQKAYERIVPIAEQGSKAIRVGKRAAL